MSGNHETTGDDHQTQDAARLSALLLDIRRRLRTKQLERARGLPVRVSPQQLRLLQTLYEIEQRTGSGLSISDLGRHLNVGRTTVSARVARLERQGLLTRSPHPGHKLAALMTLSPVARECLSQASGRWAGDPLDAALREASQQERELVFQGLEALLRLLSAEHEPHPRPSDDGPRQAH